MVKRSKSARKQGRPGRLRIVAGNWRGRVVDIADAPGLRPTSERIRETLFNWLSPRITGARCLDLYAGTGALGLEALSRGASSAVFVERHRGAAARLERNIERLGTTNATVISADAMEFLRAPRGGPFDIVFLDPPFQDDVLADLCRLLAERPVLAAGASVYLEDERSRLPVQLPAGWRTLKERQAGNVRYALVEAGDPQHGDSAWV